MAFAATVVMFGLCSTYLEMRARDESQGVDMLASVNLPAIARLATVRTELREIQTMLAEGVDGQAWGRGALQRARANFLAEWRQFASTQADADVAPTARALEDFDAATEQVRTLLLADDLTRARIVLSSRLEETARISDRALADLLDAQTNEARRAASRTAERGHRAANVAVLLDATSVVLAAMLAVLAIRATRKNGRLLEARASELEQFADRVAHDIGNPMTSVMYAFERAERELRDHAQLYRTMDRGLRNARMVNNIVRDLLNFARSGAEPDRSARTSIRDIVENVVAELARQASVHRIDLVFEPFEDAEVSAASGVVASIVSNLVRNAIVHMGDSTQRRVVLRVRCGVDVCIEVEDTGPGIPPELLGRIFEPRVRGTTRGDGLGLGLATVRRLAESHGGRVVVDSRPKKGSTFCVWLPRAESAGRGRLPRGNADVFARRG